MSLRHVTEYLPAPATEKPKPKTLSTQKPASKDDLINNIVENALALRTPQPKNGLIALKNIAKSVLILTPIFEAEL